VGLLGRYDMIIKHTHFREQLSVEQALRVPVLYIDTMILLTSSVSSIQDKPVSLLS
jgi:hypothetical protein